MKPAVFAYRDPRTLGDALALLAEHGDDASVLAGGQSLIPLMNMRLARPELIVDINRVPGLDSLRCDAHAVSIGATVRAVTVERDPGVAHVLPMLATAVAQIAHPQIRNRTTIGGNVAHADSSSELPAVLAALDGAVRLRSLNAERVVAWNDFFVSTFVTARVSDELLTEVIFPVPQGFSFRYEEFARHRGDFPVAGVCLGLRVADGVVSGARMAATGVSDRPVRLSAAEARVTGTPLERLSSQAPEIGQLAAAAVEPPADVHGTREFRRGILATLVRRTLENWQTGAAA